MILAAAFGVKPNQSVPRVGGGDPKALVYTESKDWCSPRRRG